MNGKPLSMVLAIQMFMLLAGALIIVFTKTDPATIGKTEVFRAQMIAVIAVFGIAWMADTVFDANLPMLKATLTDLVKTNLGPTQSHCCWYPSWSTLRQLR